MEVINDTQNNDLTTPTATLQTSQVSHLDTGFPIHNSLATLHRREDRMDTELPELEEVANFQDFMPSDNFEAIAANNSNEYTG